MARSRTLHEYNISRLNIVFAILGILMVAVTVGMVLDDYNRSWKQLQREFNRLELERLEQVHQEATQSINEDRLASAQENLAEAQTALDQQAADIARMNDELRQINGEWYKRDQAFRFLKAEYDVVKYEYAVATNAHDDEKAAKVLDELKATEEELRNLRLAREETESERAEVEARLAALNEDRDKAADRVAGYNEEVDAIQKRMDVIAPSLFNTVRNAAMVDFIAPSLKINQVMPGGLTYDVKFGVTARVDRCVTCHAGIEHPDWTEGEQPFRTHPNLDLYVGASSPHPLADFGCTECHQGRPRGVEFSRAAHTPVDEEQEHHWEEEYGYHEMHHWELPMLSSEYYEASCMKCHQGVRYIEGAENYNRGRDLVEHYGCYGCHKIGGYEDLPKVGPSLTRVAQKLTPEFVYRWVNDPKEFRPHTVMPRIFNLENVVGDWEGDTTYWSRRTQAEVNGIVAFLFDKSESGTFGTSPVPPGNAIAGKQAFEAVGCQACHMVGEEEDTLEEPWVTPRHFGPNLEGVASKVTPEWMFEWIQNPRAYDPTTRMPDLRLTRQEAADITAYLLTLETETPTTRYTKAPSDPAMVEEILIEYLSNTQPVSVAHAQIADLDLNAREVLLGEKIIGRQGCFGCHVVEGFEGVLPIGTELTQEGSKQLKKFAFNNIHDIPHTKPAWLQTKLTEPRIFDRGMHLSPLEKSRMPDFEMNEEQARAIVTNILGWVDHTVPLENQKRLSPAEQMIAEGERLVAQRNCRACHLIEGTGGTIGQLIEDPGYHPPNLFNEGAKVQPEWLVRFLHEPSAIRPWLNVRMPSFEFTDAELGTVANYFQALAGVEDHPYPQADLQAYPDAETGGDLLTLYQCETCHPTSFSAGGASASELAPNLTIAKERLRPEWIVAWLTDPQGQMPGTRMPSFFWDDGEYFSDEAPQEIEALRDYLMTLE